MFVLSLENANDDFTRDCFDDYYMQLVESIDFNALIGNKIIFHQPMEKQEVYGKLFEK